MTQDDEKRAALARLGLAVGGIARGGLARGGRTLADVALSLKGKVGALEALVNELKAKTAAQQVQIDDIETRMSAARQKGGQHSKDKARRAREKLSRRLLAAQKRLRQLGKPATRKDAAKDVLSKKHRTAWTRWTHEQREREIANLLRRCRRTKKS